MPGLFILVKIREDFEKLQRDFLKQVESAV